MRPWRSARASASSLLTRSTALKKRPRLPARMQARRDGDGEMRLAGPGAADQHDIALMSMRPSAAEADVTALSRMNPNFRSMLMWLL